MFELMQDASSQVSQQGVWVYVHEHPHARRLRMRFDGQDGVLKITVPRGTQHRHITDFLIREAAWIKTQRIKAQGPVWLEHGTEVPVRGVPHRIEATGHIKGLVQQVKPFSGTGGPDRLLVPGFADFIGRKTLNWLKNEAKGDIGAAIDFYSQKLGVSAPHFGVRDTRSRWGSCSSTGRLSFSWRLIMAPGEVLAYVVAHEVAHLKEMNHSDRFWTLVKALKPDYIHQANWLKAKGVTLHRYQVRIDRAAAPNVNYTKKRGFFWPL